MLYCMREANTPSPERGTRLDEEAGDGPSIAKPAVKKSAEVETGPPSMAVSIAGISTACSKDALVSSAKAVREALSTE